jgi:RHS repeat-associated protein
MGRRLDAFLDAYDFRAREYAPSLARFLQRDIVTAPNLYVFVQNNPLVATDPAGRERQKEQPAASTEDPWWRFTIPFGDYEANKYAVLHPVGRYESGYVAWNVIANLGRSFYNVLTVPVNALSEAGTLPGRGVEYLGGNPTDKAFADTVFPAMTVYGEFSSITEVLASIRLSTGALITEGSTSRVALGPGAALIEEYHPNWFAKGEFLEIQISRSRAIEIGGPEAEAAINWKYELANDLISTGEEVATINGRVPYDRQLSRQFIFENYPELARRSVSSTRIPAGWNVDEALSRFLGGRQSPFNQAILPGPINTWLGRIEQLAVQESGLAAGTPLVGIIVNWVR